MISINGSLLIALLSYCFGLVGFISNFIDVHLQATNDYCILFYVMSTIICCTIFYVYYSVNI